MDENLRVCSKKKETKTALILEPWGVNGITSDEMQFLELVYISGNFFFKFKKDSEFLTKLSSSREISVVVSSEAITYQKKKSDIQLGRKKFTSTCNVTQLGRFAMCN